jgi:hypothetical protein
VVDIAGSVPKGSVAVIAGTKKGAFVFHSKDRRRWKLAGPFMEGVSAYHAILDPRDGRTMYGAAPHTDEPWGPALYRGRIGGTMKPTSNAPRFREGFGLAVKRLWHIEPGPADEPDSLYVGVEPAALFRSGDRGETWDDIEALNYHPTRKEWQPGNGGLCLHSVLVDPKDSDHLVVGASAVGTFETRDGGRTWTMENRGVRADFMPNKYPEWGQCVHHLAWDSAGDGSIFQQNHCGTYRRGPEGGRWTEISKGLPSDFGFPIAADPHEPGSAYVAPLESGMNRVPPGRQLAVWSTRDAGKRWRKNAKGLPGPHAYAGVLREGLATYREDPVGVYVGTNTGQLYASRDAGSAWSLISANLPTIHSVSAAQVR